MHRPTSRPSHSPAPTHRGLLLPPSSAYGLLMLCLPLSLYLQTSNSIEITGRASAVHTFLQKAPGVGASSYPCSRQHVLGYCLQPRVPIEPGHDPFLLFTQVSDPYRTAVRVSECMLGRGIGSTPRAVAGKDPGSLLGGLGVVLMVESGEDEAWEEALGSLSTSRSCHRNQGSGVRYTCRSPGRSTTSSRR